MEFSIRLSSLWFISFLWLFIIIIATFIHCSHQLLVGTHHNNFSATLYWALYWSSCAFLRGKGRRVYLFRFCWSFHVNAFLVLKSCTWLALQMGDQFYVGLALAWKMLSIYLYYLVIINMLSFNRRVVMFLLRTALESNQILTDLFKNMKI